MKDLLKLTVGPARGLQSSMRDPVETPCALAYSGYALREQFEDGYVYVTEVKIGAEMKLAPHPELMLRWLTACTILYAITDFDDEVITIAYWVPSELHHLVDDVANDVYAVLSGEREAPRPSM
ncbi:hypothetical protein ACIBG8_19440 [Nonomuraea sp. NPDC050556]|uniref:hypothetical protein n=1 Tax=Nonomuraea sp. NPDC050556 TaxID=3364369 RepID=UPI003798AF6F